MTVATKQYKNFKIKMMVKDFHGKATFVQQFEARGTSE